MMSAIGEGMQSHRPELDFGGPLFFSSVLGSGGFCHIVGSAHRPFGKAASLPSTTVSPDVHSAFDVRPRHAELGRRTDRLDSMDTMPIDRGCLSFRSSVPIKPVAE